MVNGKLSIKDEMKKKSVLDIFSKRATSTNSIRLRSFEKRDENSRRSRSGANAKKQLKTLEDTHEPDSMPQEGIYEEIQFDNDDDVSS